MPETRKQPLPGFLLPGVRRPRRRPVGHALFLQPAAIGDRRGIRAGRDFLARLKRQKHGPLVLQDDPVLQEDHLLEMNELRRRRDVVDQIHDRMRPAAAGIERLNEEPDDIPAIGRVRTGLVEDRRERRHHAVHVLRGDPVLRRQGRLRLEEGAVGRPDLVFLAPDFDIVALHFRMRLRTQNIRMHEGKCAMSRKFSTMRSPDAFTVTTPQGT